MPDFFIVGQPKSGTTALYEMLRRHPEIFMPDVKEPMFLAADLRQRFHGPRIGSRYTRSREYLASLPTTLEEYLALFEDAMSHQQLGEASVLYLFSRTAAASIGALNPAARIIVIFREPASFLRSYHLQQCRSHQESERDLRKAIALEATRESYVPRGSYSPQELLYSQHVCYTEQLRRYRAVFPAEQVLTLIYDDYRSDNEATVQRVCDFLGVDSSVPLLSVEANPTVAVRSQLLDDAVQRFSAGWGPFSKAVKSGIKAVVPQSARRHLLQSVQSRIVYSPPPPPDDDLMAELRIWLRPEVERFSEYLDRDLVRLWGYDMSD
ncbi:MAG: sulfotransferase [Actinomycetota bacterium]|nr:sulfotransferase [Actinomycetota bacterium]